MSEQLIETPIDKELTHLPLPVLMTCPDFELSGQNFHHHFHPERSEHLGYDLDTGRKFKAEDPRLLEGRAVRFCRGQDIPAWLHTRYNQIFAGPPLPETSRDKFITVVLACAGIVPRQAIELYRPGEYEIVDLSDDQHDFIRRKIHFEGANGVSHRAKKRRIGNFLAEYTIANSLPGVMAETEVRTKVGEFLRPKSESHRVEAARTILTHAIDASVAELVPLHQEALRAGLVTHSRRSLTEVVLKFFTQNRFVDYFEALEDQAYSLLSQTVDQTA